MKKLNLFMLIQWLVFSPIILPISIILGAIEGIKMAYTRAETDILEIPEIA
jgi:hypothetical protein